MLLSPLLFALAIEPLAIAIRHASTVKGFKRGGREDKISLYADDALLFLGDIDQSLTSVMTLIKTFGSFLGFAVNREKPVLFPVDETALVLPQIAQISFKYLDIWVSSNIKEYLNYNLVPILEKCKLKSRVCTRLPLSVVRCAYLIKLFWAPQLLYVLHNSPMCIPLKWFKKIDSLFRVLLWKGQIALIKLFTLQLPKDRGVWLFQVL